MRVAGTGGGQRLIVIAANPAGDFLLRWELQRRGTVLGASVLDYVRVIFDPWVALGISLLILWLVSRMALLSWADLTYVLPVTALGYVLTVLAGRVLLAEQVSGQRWAGTLLIVAGVFLVGSTPIRTTASGKVAG